jgi:hypothetical protein
MNSTLLLRATVGMTTVFVLLGGVALVRERNRRRDPSKRPLLVPVVAAAFSPSPV